MCDATKPIAYVKVSPYRVCVNTEPAIDCPIRMARMVLWQEGYVLGDSGHIGVEGLGAQHPAERTNQRARMRDALTLSPYRVYGVWQH